MQTSEEWDDMVITVRPPLLEKSKVLLTGHARQQMVIRRISTSQVLQVIRSPHEFLDADLGRTRARRIRAGGQNAIDVVYELELDQVIVVTAIAKHWKKQ